MAKKWGLALLALGLAACDASNPVAPVMEDAGGGGAQTTYLVSLRLKPAELVAGSNDTARLTITVRPANGNELPESAEVTVSTSLGFFSGQGCTAPQMCVVTVTGDDSALTARLDLLPGDEAGTAEILASLGDSIGRTLLPIRDPGAPPMADFQFEIDTANDMRVQFLDASMGCPCTYSWKFGDSARGTSTRQNPRYTYTEIGVYAVTLTVRKGSFESSKSQFVSLEADPPVPDFQFAIDDLRVQFLNVTMGQVDSYLWDFGDGTTSSVINPEHTYALVQSYAVTLTATGPGGTASKGQIVSLELEAPMADFQFAVDGLDVQFLDISMGEPTSFLWDFGDGTTGTPENVQQNPRHTYAAAGTYAVTLTVTGAGGSTSKNQLVAVGAPANPQAPVADFCWTPDPSEPLLIFFTDQSTNTPDSWSWTFFDADAGNPTQTSQSPANLFSKQGLFIVQLIAANSAGSGSVNQQVCVDDGTDDGTADCDVALRSTCP